MLSVILIQIVSLIHGLPFEELTRRSVVGPSFESEFAKAMLTGHSKARADVKASNMMHLQWDQELANLAAFHAEGCIYEHGNSTLDDGTPVGQNMGRIAWQKNAGTFPAKKHVENWVLEKEYFNLDTAECEDMGLCGHYSQLLWAPTTKLGCAHKFCPNMQSDMIVCNYRRAGNYPGAKAYEKGAPCSNCNLKGGTACVEGQCVACGGEAKMTYNDIHHNCAPYASSKCPDDKNWCSKVLEDICNHDMYRPVAEKYCSKFCKFC